MPVALKYSGVAWTDVPIRRRSVERIHQRGDHLGSSGRQLELRRFLVAAQLDQRVEPRRHV